MQVVYPAVTYMDTFLVNTQNKRLRTALVLLTCFQPSKILLQLAADSKRNRHTFLVGSVEQLELCQLLFMLRQW